MDRCGLLCDVWRLTATEGIVCFPQWSSAYLVSRSQTVILGALPIIISFQKERVFLCWTVLIRRCSVFSWNIFEVVSTEEDTFREDRKASALLMLSSPPNTNSSHCFSVAARKNCYVIFSLFSKSIFLWWKEKCFKKALGDSWITKPSTTRCSLWNLS